MVRSPPQLASMLSKIYSNHIVLQWVGYRVQYYSATLII